MSKPNFLPADILLPKNNFENNLTKKTYKFEIL